VVIADFELIDALSSSKPLAAGEQDAAINVGGLVKVTCSCSYPAQSP